MQKIAVAAMLVVMAGCAHIAQPPEPPAVPKSPPLEAWDEPPAPEVVMPAALTELEASTELEIDSGVSSMPPEESVSDDDAAPSSLWDRVRAGFSLGPDDDALVSEWERWYASRPDYLARMIGRSSHFLFHVVAEVEKRGMPAEIALLPMIESAYNPVAYSKADASGMWQFIASTGKHYGLRQSWWYDGRRDVIEATEAALEYLDKLHGMFGDWSLALAAYNCGEGAVRRAIERNRARGLPTHYEALTLPTETREYVPKLIAVKNLISDPAQHGLTIEDIPNEAYFDTVHVKEHMDVALAARFAEIPLEEFRFLNPAHRKPIIKAGEAERIVLPRAKVRAFVTNLRKHKKPLVSWKIVRLRRGEKPQVVAASHGMTLAELKRVSGVRGRRFPVGQPLLVRVRSGVEAPHLPDIAVQPVTISQAFRAAKARGRAKVSTRPARKATSRAGKATSRAGKAASRAKVLRKRVKHRRR